MDSIIKAQLEQEELTPFHKALLQHVKAQVQVSRRKMSDYYTQWDHHDDVYRGIKTPDVSDKKASERGEPVKMVVPLSYAQVQTFVAFCMSMYYQRPSFFELEGRSVEDVGPAKVGEALLNQNLEFNRSETFMYQFLLDVARFGLGITKVGWTRITQMTMVEQQSAPLSFLGTQLGEPSVTVVQEEALKYLGNKVVNISPYRFFPDVRLPLTRFQEGEYCASEDEFAMVDLRDLERMGQVAGISFIKRMSQEGIKTRQRFKSLHDADGIEPLGGGSQSSKTDGMCILTECQIKLVPSRFEIDGKPMGEETYPVKYNVWYVNDQRIVKCEPLGYVHNQFTYTVGQYNPDQHNLCSPGLCDSIDKLQEVITWFINSHITSVRKTIDNKFIVDPSGVEMSDLVERRPVIRLKDSAQRQGEVGRWIQQLQVTDVTSRHMQDAEGLEQIVQMVTGINDNALGQFNTGRRSATEARNVNSASSARLKVIATLLWISAIRPMGEQMLSNLQDGLDEETYVRVLGDYANPQVMQQFKKVTKKDLIGSYDFSAFDGTLPSERNNQATALQEFISELVSVPGLLPALGYDLTAMVKAVLELRGIKNPDKFRTPVTPMTIVPPAPQPGQPMMPQPQQPMMDPTMMGQPAQANATFSGLPS